MEINIKAKLKAYTRASIPTKISELEDDMGYINDLNLIPGKLYLRTKGEWVETDSLGKTYISLPENSGLNLEEIHDGDNVTYKLSVREQNIKETQLPTTLEDDTVYYVEDLTPTNFVNGGTSFSDGDNEYVTISEYDETIFGGAATTTHFNEILLPIDSQGLYNGN